jgi:hypothetical protein
MDSDHVADRPPQQRVVDILDSAAALPVPEQVPGGAHVLFISLFIC